MTVRCNIIVLLLNISLLLWAFLIVIYGIVCLIRVEVVFQHSAFIHCVVRARGRTAVTLIMVFLGLRNESELQSSEQYHQRTKVSER